MQQVLEAPEIQDEERSPIAIDDGDPTVPPREKTVPAAKTARRPFTPLRAVIAALTRQRPEHISEYGTIAKRPESALDYVYQIDPYLCIRALIG